MTYNSELQSNNADLQAILDTVNALPDAGAAIAFAIYNNNIQYALVADEGMTWGEWLDSEFNTTTLYANGEYVSYETTMMGTVVTEYLNDGSGDSVSILTTDAIIEGHFYA